MSSSTISTLLILGLAVGAGLAIWKRCDWFGMCGSKDPVQELQDEIASITHGNPITSIASDIGFQTIDKSVAPHDKSVDLAGAGPLTYSPAHHQIMPVALTNPIGANINSNEGVTTGASTGLQKVCKDASGKVTTCHTGYARAMSAITITGGSLSYF